MPAWTNAHGWRDSESDMRPSQNVRVVALGDSFTFGVSVDYGERFSEYLEADCEDLEVINLGVNAFGTDQSLRALEVEGVLYSPDVVLVLAFLTNDLDDIRYTRHFSWPKPHYELVDGRLRLFPPLLTWDVRLRSSCYLGELAMRPLDRFLPRSVRAPSLEDADTVPLFIALVERMRDVAEAAEAEFLVVWVWDQAGLEAIPERQQKALDEVAAAGIASLDPGPAFRSAALAGENLFAPDGHWSAAGHRIIAELISEDLVRRGWR